MITMQDFITLLQDDLGIPLTADDAELPFDQVPDWDSVHLLSLLSTLERRTGKQISMPAVLEASSLKEIYVLAVQP